MLILCCLFPSGVVPFSGCTFMAYEFLDKAWGKPKKEMTVLENFINGCLAAAFAQVRNPKLRSLSIFSHPFPRPFLIRLTR